MRTEFAVIVCDNDDNTAKRVKSDQTGRAHATTQLFQLQHVTKLEAHHWNGRWAGPKGGNYACDTKWVLFDTKLNTKTDNTPHRLDAT